MAPPKFSLAAGAATAAALVAIVAALMMLGPPSRARERRLDDMRVEDLSTLSNAVEQYWTKRAALPDTLDSLMTAHVLGTIPTDPVSKASYRYHVTGARSYRLCATFTTKSDSAAEETYRRTDASGAIRSWHHGAGESCFDLTAPAKTEK